MLGLFFGIKRFLICDLRFAIKEGCCQKAVMEEPSPFRTDYIGHDVAYRRRREKGMAGWDDGTSLRQTLEVIENFLRDAGLPTEGSMLELGCGAGDLMLPWAMRGYKVYGVDVSPYAIEWARQKFSQAGLDGQFFVGDVTQELELGISPVDLVLDGHCLHCIIGKDHRQAFLANSRKYLKRGGILHINTMCGDPHHAPSLKHFDAVHRVIAIDGVAMRYFGKPEDILREMAEADFEVVKSQIIPAQYDGDEDCLLINARC